MKRFSFIILLFSLLTLGCQPKQTTQNKTKTSIISDSIDIFGKWYYTEYTDSTIKYKKIYDYSWSLASFAYEVSIDKENPDSVIFKGYHENWTSNLKKISKNIYQTGDKDQYWTLTFEKSGNATKLHIIEFINPTFAQKADPKEYELSRKELNINNEELYFAKNIIAGEYTDSKTDKTLILKENLDLIGIDSLNKYTIQIDPWEMVPQMDIITFYEEGDNNKRTDYNWKFKGDSLILSSIISLYDNGKTTGPDVKDGDYAGAKINKVIYRLIRIK
ncbi:MAG: hypothetical protein ACYC25_02985 [Paludibacter sp.]